MAVNMENICDIYHDVSESKAVPLRHAGAKGERKHSSYSFLTSALDGVSGQHHAPAALYPQESTPNTQCTGGSAVLRAGLDTEASAGDRIPVAQSVVRHYTDWLPDVSENKIK
jgi:hypothetical protein